MNPGFKLRYDQMRENHPASEEPKEMGETGDEDGQFHPYGLARNLCLVWPNGKRAFFNYAYLVSAGFDPTDEMNVIRLVFSSHSVTIKGYGLEPMFMNLLDHLLRIVAVVDSRYATPDEITQVLEIIIED